MPQSGSIGDRLVLDRDAEGQVRMRVALNSTASGDTDPFRGLRAAPSLPKPITLTEELARRRVAHLPVEEVFRRVMDFLHERYEGNIEVDELDLKLRLGRYLERTRGSGWSRVQTLCDKFIHEDALM